MSERNTDDQQIEIISIGVTKPHVVETLYKIGYMRTLSEKF